MEFSLVLTIPQASERGKRVLGKGKQEEASQQATVERQKLQEQIRGPEKYRRTSGVTDSAGPYYKNAIR